MTTMGFVCFSFDPSIPHFRAIVTAILMNMSISFRWAFNQLIPSVSYLTNLDRYAIISFLFLIILLIWHALIGSSLFTSNDTDEKRNLEIFFLYAIAGVFILFNLIYFINSVRLFLFRRLTDRKIISVDKSYTKKVFFKFKRDKNFDFLKQDKHKIHKI